MTSTATPTARVRTRVPGRGRLVAASLLVLFGSFMPWVSTAAGNISGARGAGVWTFYAALLGIAGAIIPLRRVGAVQAAIMAVAAIALPIWQVIHLLSLVGTAGWLPGPGLVLVLGGGVLAAVAARQLYRA